MQHVEVASIADERVETDGTMHLRIEGKAGGSPVILTIPPALVAALAPTFRRAAQVARKRLDPTREQFFVEHPRSVRVLLHKPTAQAIVRFDEGREGQLDFALEKTLMRGLVDQGSQCMQALEKRGLN